MQLIVVNLIKIYKKSINMSTNALNDVKKHYELNSSYAKVGDKNVWVEFTGLARDYNAVNLGQVK